MIHSNSEISMASALGSRSHRKCKTTTIHALTVLTTSGRQVSLISFIISYLGADVSHTQRCWKAC